MPKEEWGVKRLCPTTGKRFYDMNRSPIVSPYTGEVVEIETGRKSTAALTQSAKSAKSAAAKDQTDDEDVILDEDDTADVDLGDDVLDDEDDNDNVSLDDLTDVASDSDDD